MSRFECQPWPVPVEVYDNGTVTVEVQIRCGCTDELWKEFGHEQRHPL